MVFVIITLYILVVLITIAASIFVCKYFTLCFLEEIPASIVIGIFWPLSIPVSILVLFAMYCNCKFETIVNKIKGIE